MRRNGFLPALFLILMTRGYAMDENGCLATYRIDRGSSPWRGLTSSAEEETANRTVQAIAFPAENYAPIPSLLWRVIHGMDLIARSEGERRVAVNAALFSALSRADATRRQDAQVPIGRCTEAALRLMSPREIAEFLVTSQIVITYWHVESNLCLEKETDDGIWYAAFFRGNHVYFTDRRHQEEISFRIRIGKATGEILLAGSDA